MRRLLSAAIPAHVSQSEGRNVIDPAAHTWLMLFPSCGPETCSLLPVWSGQHIGQHRPRDHVVPVGYVESCLYEAFTLWRAERARDRDPSRQIWPATDLDMSADRWLFVPAGTSEPPYSSRPAFTRWWRQQLAAWQRSKAEPLQGVLL